MSRTSNSIRNALFAVSGYFLKSLALFANRTFFIKILSAEYLGIGSLFSNILTVLSLSELGVGAAFGFALYAPLAKDDKETIKSLMGLFRKVYITIGAIILVLGSCLAPFLHLLVANLPDNVDNICFIYLIFVANTGVSYFFSYNRILLASDQKQYIVSLYSNIFIVLLNIVQIVVLYCFRNYLYYIMLMPVFTVIENAFVTYKANSIYPYLQEKYETLGGKIKEEIVKNVKALLYHKIGGIFSLTVDVLLISKLFGLVATGIYSNYQLIISFLNTINQIVIDSIMASFGNVACIETDDRKLEVFNNIKFIFWWFTGWCTCCLLGLFNPFISIWAGEKYLFDSTTVIWLCAVFTVSSLRCPLTMTKSAMGLYDYDKWRPIVEVILNTIISIVLAKIYGVTGIFAGTVLTLCMASVWCDPYVLFRYGLHASLKPYFRSYLEFWILLITNCILTMYCCHLVEVSGVEGLIILCFICLIVPNLFFFIVFYKRREFAYLINLIKNKFFRKMV